MRTLPLVYASLLALAAGCGSSSAQTPATTAPPAATTSGDTATAPTATTETAPTTAPPATSPTAETAPTATTATAPTPATTEPTAPATTTPAATTPAAAASPQVVARGRAVLNRACGNCHEPDDRDGPNPGKNWAEARMRSQVRQGQGRMRAIPVARLSDADLDALIAYLRSTHAVQ